MNLYNQERRKQIKSARINFKKIKKERGFIDMRNVRNDDFLRFGYTHSFKNWIGLVGLDLTMY